MKLGLMNSWMRTLLIQASWNYERMIGIGVAYAIAPLLRDLPGGRDGEKNRRALGRAVHQFNAHPYFAGLAVGAFAKTEHQGLPDEQMGRFRTALAGPLGSVGDKLVWGSTVPIASAIGLLLAVLVSPVAGVLGLLIAHNVVHFVLRIWAYREGWSSGIGVGSRLGAPVLKWGLLRGSQVTAFAVGLALPIVTAWLVSDFEMNAVAGVGVVTGVGVVLSRWLLPRLGGIRFGLVVMLIAGLAGWL